MVSAMEQREERTLGSIKKRRKAKSEGRQKFRRGRQLAEIKKMGFFRRGLAVAVGGRREAGRATADDRRTGGDATAQIGRAHV